MATADVVPGDIDTLVGYLSDDHDPDENYHRGNVRQLLIDVANCADYLTVPKTDPPTLVEHHVQGAKLTNAGSQLTSGDPYSGTGKIADNRENGLPLAGTSVEDFFTHARELCKQNISSIGQTKPPGAFVTLQKDYRNFTYHIDKADNGDEGPSGFSSAVHDMLQNYWSGDAQAACLEYLAKLEDYLTNSREASEKLADKSLRYSSTIRAARKNVIDNMRTFRAKIMTIAVDEEASREEFAVAGFQDVLSIALNPGSVTSYVSTVATIAGQIASAEIQNGVDQALGNTCSATGTAYLNNQRLVLERLTASLNAQATSVSQVHIPQAPPSVYKTESVDGYDGHLPTKDSFDKHHGELKPKG